jgi:osmoprotectant transport system permease protein
MKIALCPSCKREILEDSKLCSHCDNPVVSVLYKSVFSWPWADKVMLFSIILIFIAFFQPWFPGGILYRDNPLSAYTMLLNIGDLDIDFLQSYNILRMALMVPILSLILFLLVYFRSTLESSLFMPIFLLLVIGASTVPTLFQTTGTLFGIILTMVLLIATGLYYRSAFRRGRLGPASIFILVMFICISVFVYQLDLLQAFYIKAEGLRISGSFGFWTTWILCGILILTVVLSSMKTVEDFWLMIFGVALSLVGYHTFVNPVFLSGPFAFFADNLRIAGVHTATHIEVVAIALLIAISTGVPIGVYITRNPTAANIVLYVASITITIPSIALFGFMMPILSSIDNYWDAVNGIGIGKVPAIIALALYSQLPIIRNTYIAIKNVDPATIEAGRGMGMTRFQLLKQLQLPLAAPVIMAGVRTAVVMSIAIAAIAAYIGAGGLGLFVSEGLQMATNDSVIVGAVSMGLLAIVADVLFEKAEQWITPAGLKIDR